MSKSELAREFSVDTETIDTWKAHGLPEDNGEFDLAAVLAWLAKGE